MRMWMVDVRLLCRKHLMGEHVENHMFVTTIEQNKSVQGYMDKNLLEVSALEDRHRELAEEIVRRGYNHKSPWKGNWDKIKKHFQWERIKDMKVDREAAAGELFRRCEACRDLYADKFANDINQLVDNNESIKRLIEDL